MIHYGDSVGAPIEQGGLGIFTENFHKYGVLRVLRSYFKLQPGNRAAGKGGSRLPMMQPTGVLRWGFLSRLV